MAVEIRIWRDTLLHSSPPTMGIESEYVDVVYCPFDLDLSFHLDCLPFPTLLLPTVLAVDVPGPVSSKREV